MSPVIKIEAVNSETKFDVHADVRDAEVLRSFPDAKRAFRPTHALVEFRDGRLHWLTITGPVIRKDGSDGKTIDCIRYRRKDGRLISWFDDPVVPEWVVQLAEQADQLCRAAAEASPEGGESR